MSGESIFRSIIHRPAGDAPVLPDEGPLPSFERATGWLNSEPLTPGDLVGGVVLVSFWTYTCVNWLRTLPYLRDWNEKYSAAGLTIVGVHTPEFDFEGDPRNVASHVRSLGIEYPVAVDSDFGVWDEFANHYWPAVYLADGNGRIRYHHFGEGDYAMTEMAIQQLLVEAGAADVDPGLVAPTPKGLEVAADWATLRSPETYLGYGQSSGFASEDPDFHDRAHDYGRPGDLSLNSWVVTGNWTARRHAFVVNEPGGWVVFAFHARDVNLVMAPLVTGASIPFRVYLGADPVGSAHGADVDSAGRGVVDNPNTYQLIRQEDPIVDRVVKIEFLAAGVEAYCFTFG